MMHCDLKRNLVPRKLGLKEKRYFQNERILEKCTENTGYLKSDRILCLHPAYLSCNDCFYICDNIMCIYTDER